MTNKFTCNSEVFVPNKGWSPIACGNVCDWVLAFWQVKNYCSFPKLVVSLFTGSYTFSLYMLIPWSLLLSSQSALITRSYCDPSHKFFHRQHISDYLLKRKLILSPQAVGSALSYLEKRQEWVLSQVGRLQERVRALGHRLGISPTDIGVIQQVCCHGAMHWVDMTLFPGLPTIPWSLVHQRLGMVGGPRKSLQSS